MSEPTVAVRDATTASTGEDPLARERRFVLDIARRARAEPGARAALRSGIGKDVDAAPRMHAVVQRALPDGVAESDAAYYAVASLVASLSTGDLDALLEKADRKAHDNDAEAAENPEDSDQTANGAGGTEKTSRPPEQKYGNTLGLTFAQAVTGRAASVSTSGSPLLEHSAETRLTALTRQSPTGLRRHLPHAVRLLASAPVTIDFPRLLRDLRRWPHHRPDITRRWLQDFYRELRRAAEEEARNRDDAETSGTSPAADLA
ncbi:type I-E CRISPR-associated protein Cse2/CasB [Actinoalloteichus caeruleus]|uniref:type I-E CRISPR-associated protein Cse2/CasB n=1 Tax=Actinoalloteichus cyanogriseus TaxID=2893586 RepID=UPI003AAE4E16